MKKLVPASFRGKPFFVEAAEVAGGRKTVVHEYPQRDIPYVEDLGRQGRGYQIDAYVLGPDYVAARDALQDALEEPGPGTLVHPYQGSPLVAVARWQVRETRVEGGYALFSIDFIETAATAFSPSVVRSPVAVVGASADTALESSKFAFLASYRTKVGLAGAPAATLSGLGSGRSLPSFTFTSLASVVSGFSRQLQTVLSPVIRGTQELASMTRTIDALIFDATGLVRNPLSLATRIGDLFHDLISWPRTPRLGVQSMLSAYRFTSDVPRPPATTRNRQFEQANYDTVDAFVRQGAVIQAARFAALAAATVAPSASTGSTSGGDIAGFDSYEEAIAVVQEVIAAIDAQAATASDDVYAALVQLSADVAAAVPAEIARLPHLIGHTPVITVPSLVLAYRLYGSTDGAEDIVRRNRVRHPGFVLGGRELQVLSNA